MVVALLSAGPHRACDAEEPGTKKTLIKMNCALCDGWIIVARHQCV